MFASTFDALWQATPGARRPRRAPDCAVVRACRFLPSPREFCHSGSPRLASRPRRAPGPVAFLCRQRGGVAVESAIAIAVLVTVCGGLMAIAHAAYTDDRMNRAARAAAQAIALAPDSSASEAALASAACGAIKGELDLDPEFDCADAWTLTVRTNLAASALANGATGNTDGGTGEMVLVEIGWEQAPWARAFRAMQGAGGRTAVGVARSEPVD